MKYRVFIRGGSSRRRTQLLIRALSDLRVISGGYAMPELDKKNGESIKGLVLPREAVAAALPYSSFSACEYDKARFFSLLPQIFEEIRERDMGFIDGILGDELSEPKLCAQLEELLKSEIPLVGTILDPAEDIGSEYERMLSLLELDDNTEVIDITELSDGEIIKSLRIRAEEILDMAHHKKFDPLMRLRAKRRK